MGGRATRRVRRLPRRAAGVDPPGRRDILRSGEKYTAVDAFAALQRLQELKAEVAQLWARVDVLVVPTIGTTFTVDEVLADPSLQHDARPLHALRQPARPVGVAVPVGITADGRPSSPMLLGPALSDDSVLAVAAAITAEANDTRCPPRPDSDRHPGRRRAPKTLHSSPFPTPGADMPDMPDELSAFDVSAAAVAAIPGPFPIPPARPR